MPKQVHVTISGEEHVSAVADQATAGLDVFGKKIPFVLDVAGLLQKGLELLAGAVGAVKDFALDSIRAFDEYATSNQRLAAQSKLTGVSVKELESAAKKARDEFGLGIAVANDAAVTTAKYASRAGDATKQNELLAAALNLGAASGLTAAQSMEALEQGLRGQDEGFDKLLGKNPSGLWKDYADANGLAVGKMTDMQKRMAELTAVIDAGNIVGNVYAERMASGAGATEAMNNKLEGVKIAFGAAIQPIRILIVQGLSKLIDATGPLVVSLGHVASFLFETFVGAFKLAQSAVGAVIEVVGKLTGSKSLEEWGKNQSQAMVRYIDDLKRMEGSTKSASGAVEQHGKAHQLAAVQITASAEATDKATKITSAAADAYFDKASKKLGKPLADLIELTTTAIGRLSDAGANQLDPMNAEQFAAAMQHLREEANKGNTAVLTLGQHTGTVGENTKRAALDMVGIARGALDAAQAFGVVDTQAASALSSVINMGTAFARLAGGDFTALPQFLGGLANVMSTLLGGDNARRQLLRDNNAALAKLSRDIGGLKLNITGEDYTKARTALAGLSFTGQPLKGPDEFNALLNALSSQGLSVSDLIRIANEVGTPITDKNGTLQISAISQLVTRLNGVNPGRLGMDFQDQLAFFKESQRIEGSAGTLGGLQGMLDFLKNVGGVTALGGIDLSNPTTARGALRDLFTQLNNGTGVPGLGKLTGSGLMDVIVSLIDQLDALSRGGSTSADVGGGIPTGGGTSIPTKTVQDVVDAMNTSVTTILKDHSGFQDRIAQATEGSLLELRQINAKMTDLIEATSNGAATLNVRIEALRQVSAANVGRGPSF